ncbi:CAP domain-containing protein [Catenuloplanes atrovinosus]|uniref:Uncharacterized protein YkwD n=1 Tax=Catenuloplanes atrovinosus TaxID=137266 RepID=A0AAE3YIX0_9ACTN|nr:CAP domain-containing protein [Catenuloplanes atrovinosus]MDR7273302.1 uncharacterized protein YkwD [Catenuloplanes atrovinosus]
MSRRAERATSQRELPRAEETTSGGRHKAKRVKKARRVPGGTAGLVALVAAVLAIFGLAAYVLPPSIGGGRDGETYDSASGADRDDLAADPAAARGADRPAGEISGEAMMGENPASPSPSPSASPSAAPQPTKPAPPAPAEPEPDTGNTGGGNTGGNTGGGDSGGGSGDSGGAATDEITSMENAVTTIVNARRAENGCGAVTTNEKLRTASRGHSADMAEQNYFNHTSLNGDTPWDRAGEAGYSRAIGENIAKGQQTPEQVMESWMNSAGHRANILNCDAKETGVGLVYDGGTPIWTQMFGAGS